MESILATQNDQSTHQPVILTGCPDSGWEMAFPVVRQLALDENSAAAMSWLDDLFQDVESSVVTRFELNLQPDFSLLEAGFQAQKPFIIADDRYIHLLEQCASQFPDARFLLFYTRAETALASAIEKDIDPDEFIAAWSQVNRRLMQFQRRYRGVALLFDAEAAVLQPSEFVLNSERMGLERLESEIELPEIPAAQPGVMARLVARYLLSDAVETLTLQDELEAIAIPLRQGEVDRHRVLTDVLGEYQQSKTDFERMTCDRDEKTRVIADQSQRLEALETERDQQNAAAQQTEQQLKQITQELEAFKEKQSQTSEENDLLLLQLHQVREELEAVFLNKLQLENERKTAETEHQQLQEQHDRLASAHDVQQKSLVVANQTVGELKQQLENERKAAETEHQQLQEQHDRLASEHDALQKSLAMANNTVGELKQQFENERKIAEAEHQKLQEQHDKLASEHDALQKSLAMANNTVGELKQQLANERKAAETERQTLKEQHDKLANEHGVQQKSLAVANSTVGELEQQLNHTRQEVVAHQLKQSETEQENELLLLQLHQVQEELEHYYLLYQESTQKTQPEETKAEDDGQEQESEPAPEEQKGGTNRSGLFGLFRRGKGKAQKLEQETIRLLNDSGLFDKEWYLSEYPDVAESNYEPVKHYLRFGAAEDRDPSPDFSTSFYIGSNPDILKSGVNPLVHYIRSGRDEGRLPRDMSAD